MADAFCEVIDLKDSESLQAINLINGAHISDPARILRLHLDRYVYYFFKVSEDSMACIKFDCILLNLVIVSRSISISSQMIGNLLESDFLRILKNYGQFPDNCHLLVRGSKTGATKACYLIKNGNTFSFGEILSPTDPAMQYVCHTQLKIDNKLYLFQTKIELEETLAYSPQSLYLSSPRVFGYFANGNLSIVLTQKIFDLQTKSITSTTFKKNTNILGYAVNAKDIGNTVIIKDAYFYPYFWAASISSNTINLIQYSPNCALKFSVVRNEISAKVNAKFPNYTSAQLDRSVDNLPYFSTGADREIDDDIDLINKNLIARTNLRRLWHTSSRDGSRAAFSQPLTFNRYLLVPTSQAPKQIPLSPLSITGWEDD